MLAIGITIIFSNYNIDVADRTTIGLSEVMNDVMINDTRFIRMEEFEKLMSISNPTRGKDIMCFKFHWLIIFLYCVDIIYNGTLLK